MMGRNNPLRKLGLLQSSNSGVFGPRGKISKKIRKSWLDSFLF